MAKNRGNQRSQDGQQNQQSQNNPQQQGGSRQLSQRGQGQNQNQENDQQQPGTLQEQILGAVTPAFQEVRTYVEGSPVRAAAIGAIAGGLLMTLFSTEKGRAFVRVAYDYANPMVAKYAREYISKAAGDMAESAIAH